LSIIRNPDVIRANHYFLTDGLLRFPHNLVRVRQRKNRDEIGGADWTAMALERLQARTAAGIPDVDGAVSGRRRQPGRVVREGHRADWTAMALERLQARAPPVAYSWPNTNSFWLFVLKQLSDQTTCRTEQECGCIGLKRVAFDCPFVVHDESPCVLNKLSESVLVTHLLLALASRPN
jgi:hypothetical protein